jgi:hypothetical protein
MFTPISTRIRGQKNSPQPVFRPKSPEGAVSLSLFGLWKASLARGYTVSYVSPASSLKPDSGFDNMWGLGTGGKSRVGESPLRMDWVCANTEGEGGGNARGRADSCLGVVLFFFTHIHMDMDTYPPAHAFIHSFSLHVSHSFAHLFPFPSQLLTMCQCIFIIVLA